MWVEFLGIIRMGFDVKEEQRIRLSALVRQAVEAYRVVIC
jgi:hypothetical protein